MHTYRPSHCNTYGMTNLLQTGKKGRHFLPSPPGGRWIFAKQKDGWGVRPYLPSPDLAFARPPSPKGEGISHLRPQVTNHNHLPCRWYSYTTKKFPECWRISGTFYAVNRENGSFKTIFSLWCAAPWRLFCCFLFSSSFPKQSTGFFCPTVLGHIFTTEFGFSGF